MPWLAQRGWACRSEPFYLSFPHVVLAPLALDLPDAVCSGLARIAYHVQL